MSDLDHHFMIVKTMQSRVVAFELVSICVQLYGGGGSAAASAFLAINDCVATDGKVSSGQILYIPPQSGLIITTSGEASVKDADAIKRELVLLNNSIKALPEKAKKQFAEGHHFIAAALTGIGTSGHAGIDLAKSQLKLARESVSERLEHIENIAHKLKQSSNRGLHVKVGMRHELKREINNLDTDMTRLIRIAGTADQPTRVNFATTSGAKWQRMVYDLKRVGMNARSLSQVSRHINASIAVTKHLSRLTKAALIISFAESAHETLSTCRETGFGAVCGATAGVEGAGFAGSILSGIVAEKYSEGFGEVACNAALDPETFGTGAVACNIIFPATIDVIVSILGGSTAKFIVKNGIHKRYPNINLED